MKLSIEATDKLKNKDFHYELTVSKDRKSTRLNSSH